MGLAQEIAHKSKKDGHQQAPIPSSSRRQHDRHNTSAHKHPSRNPGIRSDGGKYPKHPQGHEQHIVQTRMEQIAKRQNRDSRERRQMVNMMDINPMITSNGSSSGGYPASSFRDKGGTNMGSSH